MRETHCGVFAFSAAFVPFPHPRHPFVFSLQPPSSQTWHDSPPRCASKCQFHQLLIYFCLFMLHLFDWNFSECMCLGVVKSSLPVCVTTTTQEEMLQGRSYRIKNRSVASTMRRMVRQYACLPLPSRLNNWFGPDEPSVYVEQLDEGYSEQTAPCSSVTPGATWKLLRRTSSWWLTYRSLRM